MLHSCKMSYNTNEALLLPKLRSKFAEFLKEGFHVHLRILSSSTCVGLRYGHLNNSLEDFLGSMDSVSWKSRRKSSPPCSELMSFRICLEAPPTWRPHIFNRVPTNPERTGLPQETLDIRCCGFLPQFRYSCRQSLF